MPPGPVTTDQLRTRATALRRLAVRIDGSLAVDLHRRAGDDTWLGPTPRRCHDDLVAMRNVLLAAGDELRTRAADLDRRAALLEPGMTG